MKVLILTQYYAPEPAFKMPDLARALVKRGHEVEVLTGYPCYPAGKTYPGYRQAWPSCEVDEGVRVRRVPQFPDHSRSGVRRALYYLSFALSAAFFGAFVTGRADVLLVYQSAMPTGLAGRWISFCRRTPMVLDVVDLWPESVTASGMLKNATAVWLIERAIRYVYRGATKINVITQGYRANLLKKGVQESKLSLIHCWPAAGRFDPAGRSERLDRELQLDRSLVVTYAGAIGPVQNLQTVLEAAELLGDSIRVQFCLAGDGVESSELAERAHRRGLKNVHFLGRLPAEEAQMLYGSSDALLVHLKRDPMSAVSIPSKTFAYMASGKPLLMAVEGEAAQLVRHHACGLAVPPDDPTALAQAVRRLADTGADRRRAMGDAARQAYQAHYCSEVQVGKFEALLHKAAGLTLTTEREPRLAA